MTQFKSISFIKDIQGKDIGRCKTPIEYPESKGDEIPLGKMLVPFQ